MAIFVRDKPHKLFSELKLSQLWQALQVYTLVKYANIACIQVGQKKNVFENWDLEIC